MEETAEVPKKPSKGQLYKQKTGHSKSMKRLTQKHGVTLIEYRALRKAKKATLKKAKHAKHVIKKANRSLRTKSSSSLSTPKKGK